MNDNQDLFHIMTHLRPMRRLKPDPVPDEVLEEILQASSCAANSMNTQPYRFVILKDPELRAFFGQRYQEAFENAFRDLKVDPSDNSAFARNMRTAAKFGLTMKDVPVILLVCGIRDWPFAVPHDQRKGIAPPSPGSVYPCVQNILLGCRAKGLGASLTTLHQLFEAELCERCGIPDSYGVVAAIPIGYPKGNFGPVTRRPVKELTFLDAWNHSCFE
ncbi:MAG: nitroreductase family protein [Pseudomonadota bacterium]